MIYTVANKDIAKMTAITHWAQFESLRFSHFLQPKHITAKEYESFKYTCLGILATHYET